ncbi:acyl-CoA desaturase [Patulibacter brassicae]|jgi:stearoyl-CoA desaturase (delta-9 desaturase)|uniref:Acyl-CoA desaturase n=1 Tax=Patulibacter brassicae TaxID=1705717 RepID=A0ABU4VPW2_9ACTN|nr:acyl-CoA desaturase [Patulibacter brassicae]MDX8153898.1 acyl-CoA desaturase [Patulibacter brassicae]
MKLSRATRAMNIVVVVLPFVGVLTAIALLWGSHVTTFDLAMLVGTYLIGAFGVTIGFHRLLTHGAVQAKPWVRYGFVIAGSTAIEGPALIWAANHRKHHSHTDQEGDPHSPHVGGGEGLRGLLHAHMGWLWSSSVEHGTPRKHCPDLVRDRGLVRISKAFPYIALASLGLPFVAGWLYHGTLGGGLQTFVWAGLVRIFFLHHVTWSINSICHFSGYTRFDVDDHSRNNPFLAILSLGESWHHNHHAFPRSASHGMRWYEVDLSALVIRAFVAVGLMSKPVFISRERQAEKLAGAGGTSGALASETAA